MSSMTDKTKPDACRDAFDHWMPNCMKDVRQSHWEENRGQGFRAAWSARDPEIKELQREIQLLLEERIHYQDRIAALKAKVEGLMVEIKTAKEYLESVIICERHCDPQINQHHPECEMLTSFEKALAKFGGPIETNE